MFHNYERTSRAVCHKDTKARREGADISNIAEYCLKHGEVGLRDCQVTFNLQCRGVKGIH